MSSASAAGDIRTALEEIWSASPSDLQRLAAIHRPPSRDLPKRMYANFDLYWMAGMYYFFLRQLREDRAPAAAIAPLLGAYALDSAARLEKWGLSDAAAVLRRAQAGFAAAPVGVGQVAEITEALIVYLNRLQAWVDATIPWAAVDELSPLDGRSE